MSRTLLLPLAAFAGLLLLGAAALIVVGRRPPGPRAASGEPAGAVEPVAARSERHPPAELSAAPTPADGQRDALDPGPSPLPELVDSSGPDEPTGTPGAGPEDLAGRIDALAEEVASLRALVQELVDQGKDRLARLDEARAERPEADWTKLQALLDLYRVDEEGARKEVQLLSEVEVVRRYGSPDLLYSTERGVFWVYGQGYDEARDAYDLQLMLQFAGGYVSGIFVQGD